VEGLIHRARILSKVRGTRNAQGERPVTPGTPGPWFDARLMERGGPAGKSRRRPEGTDARVARGYELLADAVDEAGAPVVLSASDVVETECSVLGSPTIELSTKPERLTDGEELIGWLAYSVDPSDAA
jgi:hypothetical protein